MVKVLHLYEVICTERTDDQVWKSTAIETRIDDRRTGSAELLNHFVMIHVFEPTTERTAVLDDLHDPCPIPLPGGGMTCIAVPLIRSGLGRSAG